MEKGKRMTEIYNNVTKEDAIKALTKVVEDVYAHKPIAIDIHIQGYVNGIPEVTVRYTKEANYD